MYNRNLSECKPDEVVGKILDFETDGHRFVRLFIGAKDLKNWYGDDWNDAPYEHNAGEVYGEFYDYVVDVMLPSEVQVFEPCNGFFCNSNWCKDDMKDRRVPCLGFTWGTDQYRCELETFDQAVSNSDSLAVYMGDGWRMLDDIPYDIPFKCYRHIDKPPVTVPRKDQLLRAAFDYLKEIKAREGMYSKTLGYTVNYDDTECDGWNLANDIAVELDLDEEL